MTVPACSCEHPKEQLMVPVVDMSADPSTIAELIREAGKRYGFFYVSNHGVSPGVIEKHFEEGRKFFALPQEEKSKLQLDSFTKGYMKMASQTLSIMGDQNEPDTKEAIKLTLLSEDDLSSLEEVNVWPDAELLPEYKPALLAYFKAVFDLAQRLVPLITAAMGMPENYLQESFIHPHATVRLHHYSVKSSSPQEGVFAAGAHSDWGMLTVLATDDVPGLQIFLDGTWIPVDPKPGCFIINLGDMARRWSNDEFLSSIHRVVNTSAKNRYSTALFLEPHKDTVVECLPSCCSEDNPPKYPPIGALEYLMTKYKAHGN